MALSRLQASLAAVTNEVTVAAANINFDFTLVRCEAPKEYQNLGNALSRKRKEEAESGSPHITARRLGALFEGICPPTPNLIKAYGVRVSEIADLAKEQTSEPSNSMFAAHTGVDGTSIWAAATSSSTALHVQLSACMLVSVWTAPQAISIWFELVKERRRYVQSSFYTGEKVRYTTLTAAAQADISRLHLAEWDASARSWLRTTNEMKRREQRQLMLILDNVSIPINQDMVVHSSVLSAWKSALESMEKLVTGMPQAVNSGPTLLALSTWHLYPDLLLPAHDNKVVRFLDPLVQSGGMLTVGLENAGKDDLCGVYWSLSLAHINYYGHPVPTSTCPAHNFARISFPQFNQAVFGCLAGKWASNGIDLNSSAQVSALIQGYISILARNETLPLPRIAAIKFLNDSDHWFNLMATAAWAHLDESSTYKDREMDQKLLNYGLRRSSDFFPEEITEPLFGLLNTQTLLD
ncbi:hypothetical protein OCU04_003383 [Sclerotinia nivalis]|uniref:Uncharacterized protein n=1 Tax=Sclerotinia nivalis TaxID=352851 RepID=A0A9X0DMN3_9HELO|nr:hypothetical protein OCU04_003383 [Sclerotinia nivalis]